MVTREPGRNPDPPTVQKTVLPSALRESEMVTSMGVWGTTA
jgi:hypothetical protein